MKRTYPASIALCLCATLCHAQTPGSDQALLTQARAKYDAPFTRNLQSFDCTIDFSWKQHFTETSRVGDEGTDDELEHIFQPIHNRVTVTPQKVTVSSGFTNDAIAKLPHGGMAELLLEHAVEKSLYQWLPTSTNALLPDPATPVHLGPSPSGYKLAFNMQTMNVEMAFTPDLRLETAKATQASQSDHFETVFTTGPQGFLLTSWTLTEDGNSAPGHRLIFTYTYQTVDGVQLPEHVSIIRESHHEVWRYTLRNCSVKTSQ